MGDVISVALVEDNAQHARRYRENLALDPTLRLVGEFSRAGEAIRGLEAIAPDVALIDLGLPDASGFDVLRHLRDKLPGTAVMVVSIFGDERSLIDAIAAGATGYLLKDSQATDFNHSIHALRAGESPISPSLARHLLRRMIAPNPVAPQPTSDAEVPGPGVEISPLSRRETTILEAIAHGRGIAEIGKDLFISPLTVKTHVQNIYRKLEARSRQHAVFLAQSKGFLKP